ncbi:hypothetical protein L7F22_057847 [Adiantum nelumboides]|nr:hypothetical protein [Adiantum nelumboides]
MGGGGDNITWPLGDLARDGHVNVLELLLPTNLQHLIDIPSSQGGQTALHLVAASCHARVVLWLCESWSAKLDQRDHEGNTPMHLAVALGHINVVYDSL